MSTFVPKPDAEGINSPTKATPIADLAILLSGFFACLAIFYFSLVALSDWALPKMSLQTEIRWLGSLSKDLNKNNPEDFNKLVDSVAAVAQLDFPIQATVQCDKEPNAFALPGGALILTSGVLEKIKSENGLAFILGHEIGHIVHRDHIRGMGRQLAFSMGAALLGFSDIGGFSSLSHVVTRVYSRQQETNADQYALQLMQKLYGHTWGSEELFNLLAAQENRFDRAMAHFSSTHPSSAERIDNIRASQTNPPQTLIESKDAFREWVVKFGCGK